MLKMTKLLTTSIFLVCSALPAKAVVISPLELPSEIQNSVFNMNTDAYFDYESVADYNNASIFNYYENVFDYYYNTPASALIRYSVENSYQDIDGTVTNFNGYIWLQASYQYNLSEEVHGFTLFLDQLSPIPNGSGSHSVNLGLTTTDLLDGSGFYSDYYDSDYYDINRAGSLVTDGTGLCLAEGCSADAVFNLVHLQYISDGASALLMPFLNPLDNRGVLYSQAGGDYDYSFEQVYAVQAVPVPAAVWLFGSGLLGLTGFARRRS